MKNTHAAVESAKSICLDKQSVDFDQAVNYMSRQIARIFPKSYESSTKRKRQLVELTRKAVDVAVEAVAVAAVVAGAAMEAVEAAVEAVEAAVDAVDLVVVLP